MATRPIALVVHGHFYQPPRENPWSDELETEPSASPFHDWNARIHAECYRANAYVRIHDRAGHISSIENNYSRMSFNFGPTLARWIERNDPRAHERLLRADADQRHRLGVGGAMAQAYAHPIVPLATPADRRTQLLWGLSDFRRRFGRAAAGLWLPETAADEHTLATLIDLGVRYTILAPEQIAAVRAPGTHHEAGARSEINDGWTLVDRDSVDTGRAYRWMHPDGSGRFLSVAVFDGPLSRQVAFGETTHDAAAFVAAIRASGARSKVDAPPLVLCASDGELFGHHRKFADMNLAFTAFVEGPKHRIDPTNLAAYLEAHPATWEMRLALGPDGKGTAWSCGHGVGRWFRDCGCSMMPPERGWNQHWRAPLRAALDCLQSAAADFFEDAGAHLLVDPWGARDAYGEVVDAPIAERDALLATFGTPALAAGGERARESARLLLEMQRATLLMYASCGFYFDDIAGLETALVIRLAAYAADLLKDAGGTPPLDEMLDLLATAKSNQVSGETGADVFRQVAGDRISPARAVATVALAKVASPDGAAEVASPGGVVAIADQVVESRAEHASVSGMATVTSARTGTVNDVRFHATWDKDAGFRCVADGVTIAPEQLGREDRRRLLPLLLARLVEQGAPLSSARLALTLGRGVLGTGDEAVDAPLRDAYAQLLLRGLDGGAHAALVGAADLATELMDVAGSALALGTLARARAEEHLAEILATEAGRASLGRLAARLGFAPPPGTKSAPAA